MKPLPALLLLAACLALPACQTLDRVLTVDNVARALQIIDNSQAIYESAKPPIIIPEK
jgi:hypothetical protein